MSPKLNCLGSKKFFDRAYGLWGYSFQCATYLSLMANDVSGFLRIKVKHSKLLCVNWNENLFISSSPYSIFGKRYMYNICVKFNNFTWILVGRNFILKEGIHF